MTSRRLKRTISTIQSDENSMNYSSDNEASVESVVVKERKPRTTKRSGAAATTSNPMAKRKAILRNNNYNEEVDEADREDEEDGENESDAMKNFETGQIMRIYVENFMCHRKMTVELGRHVNFITGQNGSGKSAIAAAIQLCLGATARNTGRGSSAGGLIREGSDGPAVMRVTLRNEGSDCYRFEDFGNRIIVERRIHKGGRSDYKMMNRDLIIVSHSISTEKRELDKMLTQFNIFVDNPCCVLTQEDSKLFIQGHERDKYAFFLKATGLERAKISLRDADTDIEASKVNADKIKLKLDAHLEVVKRLQREVRELQALSQLEKNIKIYSVKLLWLDYYNQEAVVTALQQKLSNKQEELLEAQQALAEAESGVESIGSMDEIRARIDEIQEKIDGVKVGVDEKRQLVVEQQKELNELQFHIRQLTNAQAENASRHNSIRREIAQLRCKALADSEGQEREIVQAINDCASLIVELQERDRLLRTERNEALLESEEMKRSLSQHEQSERNLRRDVSYLEGELRDVSGSDGNGQAARFGNEIPRILASMARTRFRGVVIGPLGMYVKVKDGYDRYAQALEKILGSQLTHFAVTCEEDRQLLQGIFRSFNVSSKYTVVSQSPRPRYALHNVPDALTAADALTIENDTAFNIIVDNTRMESIALVADEEECVRKYVGVNQQRKKCLTNGLTSAVTQDGTTINYKNGNQSSEVSRFDFKQLLAKDLDQVRNNISDQLEAKREELALAQQQFRDLRDIAAQHDAVVNKKDQQMRKVAEELSKLAKKKRDLDARVLDIRASVHIDTSNLEAEEEELQEAIESIGRQLNERIVILEAMKSELKQRQAERDAAGKKRENLMSKLRDHEIELETYINKHENAKRCVVKLRDTQLAKQRAVEEFSRVMDQQTAIKETKYQNVVTETNKNVPDWDPSMLDARDSESKLKGKIQVARQQIEREKEAVGLRGRSFEAALQKYEIARAEGDRMQAEYNCINENISGMIEDYENRAKRWSKALRKSEKKVKMKFDEYLGTKGFSGTVHFDHAATILKLICQTDCTDENSRSSDVRQLSGGERSFTTLCLLLALGHVIECPFRIMDEYDVFLDEISRKMTIEQLTQYALKAQQHGKQFVIITPNNLNEVKTTDKIRINRMQPPVRSTSHGPQQTTL